MAHSVVIRMGASGWTAKVNGAEFDFRKMNYEQKKAWYGAFMDGVRVIYGPKQFDRRSRRPRRSRRVNV